MLQILDSWPRNADIVVLTNDVSFGTLRGQDPTADVRLDFFNRGQVAGQLLNIPEFEGVENPSCDVYARTHSEISGIEAFPIRIEPAHHAYVRIQVRFHRKAPGPPPVFQTMLKVHFEVSARKGSKTSTSQIRLNVGSTSLSNEVVSISSG